MFFSSHVYAQEDQFILLTHINSRNGLPQNTIRDATFSRSGFLWLATEDGLVRFDGNHCKVYSPGNSGLTKNRIYQLIQFKNGRLYCISEGGLVFEILESGRGVKIQLANQLNHLGFSSFHLFETDSLDHFLNICKLLLPENLQLAYSSPFLVLKEAQHIIQRSKGGVVVYDRNLSVIKEIPIPNSLEIQLFQYNQQAYFKSTEDFFYRIDIDQGKVFRLSEMHNNGGGSLKTKSKINEEKVFWDYKTGQTFYVKNNMLYLIETVGNNITFKGLLKDLPAYSISSVTYDERKRLLVIGTLSNGFYIFKQRQFQVVTSPFGENIFYAQIAYPGRNSILTTRPFQEFLGNGKARFIHPYPTNELTLYCHPNQYLFYGNADTLECLNLLTMKVTKKYSIPDNHGKGLGVIAYRDFYSLYVASTQSLYAIDLNSGVFKLADFPQRNKGLRVYCILPEGDSLLHIGTDDGMYSYQASSHSIQPTYLQGKVVRTLFRSSKGLFLAGTYGSGYYAIFKQQAVPIPMDKNTALKTTHCFIQDKSQRLWMSTNNGLYCIPEDAIHSYLEEGQRNNLYYYRFSTTDGFLTNEFNGGCYPSAVQLDSSTWSLPSMQGLVWFKPDSIQTDFGTGELLIDQILLNDVETNVSDSLTIDVLKSEFKLSVYLSACHWSDENNFYIEYKLDQESKWNQLSKMNAPILVQNLKGGQHTLYIRKKVGKYKDGFQTIELKINVPKKIYNYFLFWVFLAGMLLFLSYIYTKWSVSRIRKRKEMLEVLVNEKTMELKEAIVDLKHKNEKIEESEKLLKLENERKSNLIYLITHDISTPLRFIHFFLTQATQDLDQNVLSKSDLIDIKIAAQNLQNLLDNIVEWLKQHDEKNFVPTLAQVDIYEIVQEKIELFSLMIRKRQNLMNSKVLPYSIVYSDHFILSMAIQNILANAISFTNHGEISITFKSEGRQSQIIIQDNGIGIHKFELENADRQRDTLLGYGIGLKVSTELLKMVGGTLELKSNQPSKGTTAIIRLGI